MGTVKEGWRYFVEHASELANVKDMMNGWDRVVQFTLDGEDPFYLTFLNKTVTFSDGAHPKPDLTVKATQDVLYQMMTGKLDPMKAFMLGKIKFDGSMKDAVKFSDIGAAVRKSLKFPP